MFRVDQGGWVMSATARLMVRFCGTRATIFFCAGFLWFTSAGFCAVVPPGEGYTVPFYSEKTEVAWDVETNPIPATVTIYKVVPATFSTTVISNVLRLAGYSPSNRVLALDDDSRIPKDTLMFQRDDEEQRLCIVPSMGLITFQGPRTDYRSPDVFEGVPDKSRAFDLGTNILRQMDLPPGQIQTGNNHLPHARIVGSVMTIPIMRSRQADMTVEFGRQIEGIPCDYSDQSLEIRFGSHERIERFELRWDGLKPAETLRPSTREQIIAWAKEGRASVVNAAGPMEARTIDMAEIKRLTIKEISLHYSPKNSWSHETHDEVEADRLYPYAELYAEIELGPGDTETCRLLCPITEVGLRQPTHESGSFSVYPSRLYEKQKAAAKPPPPMSMVSFRAPYPAVGSIERLDPALDDLVSGDAKVEKLAEGFEYVRGITWMPTEKQVVFSDTHSNIAYRWREGNGVEPFLNPSGLTSTNSGYTGREPGSSGLTVDSDGRLVLCQQGNRCVARLKPDGRTFTTIVDRFEGKRFNSPHALCFDRKGNLYFTDSADGMSGGMGEMEYCGVYRVTPDGKATLLTKELVFPRGIALSPDQRTLYVSGSLRYLQAPMLMSYELGEDGVVGSGRVLFDASALTPGGRAGPVGLRVDQRGNIWAAGPRGILIISPQGKQLGTILTDLQIGGSDCAFGDDGSTLYFSSGVWIFRVKTKTKGCGF
jgi:gluconolactonase